MISPVHGTTVGCACEQIYNEAITAVREHGRDAESTVGEAMKSMASLVRQLNDASNAMENMAHFEPGFDMAEYTHKFIPRMLEAEQAQNENWLWLYEDDEE